MEATSYSVVTASFLVHSYRVAQLKRQLAAFESLDLEVHDFYFRLDDRPATQEEAASAASADWKEDEDDDEVDG